MSAAIKLQLTPRQVQHIVNCIDYVESKYINYGNCGTLKSYKHADQLRNRLVDKLPARLHSGIDADQFIY